MGTITGLEVQKRNQKRVNVFIDGEYRLSLRLEDAALLKKGETLSDDMIARLEAADAEARASDAAALLLGARPRSTYEIRQNLLRKGIAPNVIQGAIERLQSAGYLDDRAFAEYWVRERNSAKPLSTRALQYELRLKGISKAIIADVLEAQDELETAVSAARGQLRRVQRLPQRDARDRLFGFLARRGYSSSTAREAIRLLFEELDEREEPFFASDDATDDERAQHEDSSF